ncbi:transmembrane protein 42-like [Gigantopelta aegis]|uniref:transmembrane protein 42-like n=1 Tax=Gigantopelta aegis TaxID=1735272 RepID=UPI001B88B7FF|nr:transmembrane protein 42-like [Gigantopelta aegis]
MFFSTRKGLTFAALAGCMAALASISAKIATSYEDTSSICYRCQRFLQSLLLWSIFEEGSPFMSTVITAVRVCGVCSMFLCNGLMLTLFSKSLQLCPSSVEATVTNTAANFIVTAVASLALFGDRLPLLWWLGASLILTGLVFIHRGGNRAQAEQTREKVS